MAKLKSSISGFLTVVAFLVLAALAAIWQNGSPQHNNSSKETISQKTQSFVWTALLSSEKLINFNLKQDTGWQEKIKDEVDKLDPNKISAIKNKLDFSSWSKSADSLKDRKTEDKKKTDSDIITWYRSKKGNSFVIKLKNGGEYKISLPTTWFKNNNKN